MMQRKKTRSTRPLNKCCCCHLLGCQLSINSTEYRLFT